MRIIIIGAGKVGETLVQNFIKEKHDVVVIDTNRETLENVVNSFDVKGVVGSGLEHDVLVEAGVSETELVIACTMRDEMNILACVVARKMGAKRTIARVRDPEYFSQMDGLKDELGLDLMFNPERRTAFEILNVLKFPSAKNIDDFAGGKAVMVEFDVTESNLMCGKSLIEIFGQFGSKVLFGLVKRGEKSIVPRGDFVIQAGDVVHVIGSEKNMPIFCKDIKIFKNKVKSVMLVGGGKVAYYLAKELLLEHVDVTILEQSSERCAILAELLPSATIICGDGTDHNLLLEENLKGHDACVTLTGSDETNIMISLYAKQKKVGKVITKIGRNSIKEMVSVLGLDTVVSTSDAVANHIIGFVRANKTDASKGINTYYKLTDKAEALEFLVDEKFEFSGIALKDLNFKKDCLIGAIVRGDEFVLPKGDTFIMGGDKVIVITAKTQITELSQVFLKR